LVLVDDIGGEWAATVHERIGRRVAAYRKAAGMTGNDLSEVLRTHYGLNLSRSTIANLETGRRPVTVAELLAFAAAVGVSPLALVVPIESGDPGLVTILPNALLDVGGAVEWWQGLRVLDVGRLGGEDQAAGELVERLVQRLTEYGSALGYAADYERLLVDAQEGAGEGPDASRYVEYVRVQSEHYRGRANALAVEVASLRGDLNRLLARGGGRERERDDGGGSRGVD